MSVSARIHCLVKRLRTVGASLLANALCQLADTFLIPRLREQARSHREPQGLQTRA